MVNGSSLGSIEAFDYRVQGRCGPIFTFFPKMMMLSNSWDLAEDGDKIKIHALVGCGEW